MNGTDKVKSAGEDLVSDFAALRDDISKLTSSVSQLVQHQASAASGTIGQAASDAKDRLSSTVSDAQSKLKGAGGELESYVERNPGVALAIAFGIGMTLGMMNHRR